MSSASGADRELRRAVASDAAAITELVQRAYAHYPERIGVRPAPMDADYADEIARKEVWVAEGSGEIQAILVLRHEADHSFVDNVAVAPDAQGEGLGARLLTLAEARTAASGRREIRLLTNERMHENRALYAHLGWKQYDHRRDGGFSRVFFRKALRADGP